MEIWVSFLLIQFRLRGLPQIFLLFDVLVKVQAIWKITIQLQNTDILCLHLTLECDVCDHMIQSMLLFIKWSETELDP